MNINVDVLWSPAGPFVPSEVSRAPSLLSQLQQQPQTRAPSGHRQALTLVVFMLKILFAGKKPKHTILYSQ